MPKKNKMTINILILLGTFLPILGLVLTFGIAAYFAKIKWYVLFFGPLFTLLLCFIFGERIAYNGNMLFVAILGLYFIFLLGYYPILIGVAIWRWVKKRKNRSGAQGI